MASLFTDATEEGTVNVTYAPSRPITDLIIDELKKQIELYKELLNAEMRKCTMLTTQLLQGSAPTVSQFQSFDADEDQDQDQVNFEGTYSDH